MKIALHTILGVKKAVGQSPVEINLPEGATVKDFIAYANERWGNKLSSLVFDRESGAVLPYVRLMVNGQTIDYLKGMETLLQEGDEILILPPASGG